MVSFTQNFPVPLLLKNVSVTELRFFCCLSMHSAWRLGFLAKKILGFFRFLAEILPITLGKVRKILQDFSRSRKEIQKILGVLGNKTKNIQDLGKKNKNVLHHSNTRSIDIL